MTGTTLKLIALICMVIDHLASFNDGMPAWFNWIGRISGPIFVYMMTEGLKHTSDKKKYMYRLYLLGIFMSLFDTFTFLTYENGFAQNYHFNNIFVSLLSICIIVQLLETAKTNKKLGRNLIFIYVLIQLVLYIGIYFVIYSKLYPMIFIINAVIPGSIYCEGHIVLVLFGVAMYYSNSKKMVAFNYILYWVVNTILYGTPIVPIVINAVVTVFQNLLNKRLDTLYDFFFITAIRMGFEYQIFTPGFNYVFCSIFALPIILLYNGKRGKGYKWLFYVFYPLHIIVLYILECLNM